MLIIADNLQITNPAIERAIWEMDPQPIKDMARMSIEMGAKAIDINSGPLSREPEKHMAFLVETVQGETDVPILLDTTNPVALEAGLRASVNKAIINGFSLEPARLDAVLPLAKEYDSDIIGYLLFPNGRVPSDEAERMHVAVELYTKFQKAGLKDERLIIDPVIAPMLWQDGTRRNKEMLTLLRNLPDLLGFPVKTIGGISNLTTGPGPLDKKLIMERTYCTMLAAAGLDMALVNIFHSDTIAAIKACHVLMERGVFSWEMI